MRQNVQIADEVFNRHREGDIVDPQMLHFFSPPRRRGGAPRLLTALLLLALSSFGLAQDTLTPTWAKASPYAPAVFSPDGKSVVTSDTNFNYSCRVWRASDAALVQSSSFDALYGLTLSGDGKTAYASDGSGVYRYDFPSLTYKGKVLTDTTATIVGVAASRDGKYLAYTTSGSALKVNLYNLTTNTVVKRWNLPASVTWHPQFTADSTKLVCDGPTVYDLAGIKLAGKTNYGYRPAISPTGDKVFQYIGATNKVIGFNLSNLSTAWTFDPTTVIEFIADANSLSVTGDGKALFMPAALTGDDGVLAVNTANGTPLSAPIQVPNGSASTVYAVASPVDNKVWIGYQTYNPATDRYEDTAVSATLNTTTGAVTPVASVAPYVNYAPQYGASTSTTSADGTPLLLSEDPSGLAALYNLNTGELKRRLQAAPRNATYQNREFSLSPNGLYSAVVGSATFGSTGRSGLIVCRNDTGAPVAYVVDATGYNDIQAVQWVSDTRLVIKRYRSKEQVSIYDWNGSNKLTLVKSVLTGPGAELAVSSDGKRALTGESRADVFYTDLEAGTSKKFTPDAPYGFDSFRFVDGTYKFSFAYIHNTETGTELVVDLYDGASGTPTLVRSFRQPELYLDTYFDQGLVSPDGKWVAIAASSPRAAEDRTRQRALTIYRAATGEVVRNYVNQIADYGNFSLNFAADSLHLLYTTNRHARVSVEMPVEVASIVLDPPTVIGNNGSVGTVTLDRATSSDSVIVLASDKPFATVPATVTILAGQLSATFPITTVAVDFNDVANISATFSGATKSALFAVVAPTALTLALNPTTLDPGAASTATVTLNGPAGPSGFVLNLASNNAGVTVPATVTVAAGQTSATFSATASASAGGTAKITATRGSLSADATLTIRSSLNANITLTPETTLGGNTLLLKAVLTSPSTAPTGGIVFNLTSDNAALAPVSKLTVKANSNTGSANVRTKPVLVSTTANLTIASGAFTKTITPPAVTNLFADVTTQSSGDDVTLLVVLNGPAAAGFKVEASSDSTLLKIPANVEFAAGSSLTLVTLKTTAFAGVANKKVTVKVGGKSISINLVPSL